MLVDLNTMKDYLDIVSNDYDVFLTQQITLVSEAIEGYCGRKFEQANYVQTFYIQDYLNTPQKELYTFHYPIIGTPVVEDVDDNPVDDFRVQKDLGLLILDDDYFLRYTRQLVEVTYTAGYAVIPATIQSVVFDLVEARYNKKKSGVALNFGTDVQRVSIPGVISIDFDYTLTLNDRKNKYYLQHLSHMWATDCC